jgi:hypothetical protein
MAFHVNLMSEKAQFHSAARRLAVRWALVLATVVTVLVPIGAFEWQRRRGAVIEQEALEAQYEPIRQLTVKIRQLRTEAEALVRNERILLELARDRSPSTLLALVGQATAAAHGELFVKRLTLTQIPVRDKDKSADAERLTVEASGSVAYDVQRFVKNLEQQPLTEVKVLTTERVTESGAARKSHGIEGAF